MAERLLEYFARAKEIGGILAVTKLAMISKISSPRAKGLPDSPENVKVLEDALAQLRRELGK